MSTDKVIKSEIIDELWNELQNSIKGYNEDLLSLYFDDSYSILDKTLDTSKFSSYPIIFIQLLSVEFPKILLNSFKQTYCLSHSDAILIFIKELKL